jgi:choline dehydrogenase
MAGRRTQISSGVAIDIWLAAWLTSGSSDASESFALENMKTDRPRHNAEKSPMNIKFITIALVAVTTTLFGGQSSPPQDQNEADVQDTIEANIQNEPDLADIHGKNGPNFKNEADIIVIGGGTAGCILMKELSENGRFSVLGIEGGRNLTTDPAIKAVGIPAFQLALTGKSMYFWPGWNQTLPMAGFGGGTGDWTTGMLLGGGSSVNGLYYGRGSSAAYALWAGVSGSTNWSLDNILATFTALENYQGLTISQARGNNGAVNVLQTPTVSQLTLDVLLPATQSAFPGIPTVSDYNDASVENCLDPRAQWFIDPAGAQRVSSATAFLNSSVMTPQGQGVNGHKLSVLFDAVAVQIVFDKKGTAKGVKYILNGKTYTAKARKAVVLAAGINSSKLLQLSGIGPAQALQNAGIVKPVFINENVGKNLQNHPLLSISLLADPAENGIPAGAAYAYTIHNVYLPAVGGGASDPRTVQILFNYAPATTSAPPLLNLSLELLNPQSTGSVTIQSANPFQIAAVDDGFYQNPADLANMKNAVEVYVHSLLDQLSVLYPFPSPYFKPMVSDPINTVILSGYDDAVVEAYVKNNSNLSLDPHHFTSHCKMAPLNAGGVVDGNTLVYGTKNVYVADDSICPVIPDTDTTAAAMMIGLRTSEILKQVLQKK